MALQSYIASTQSHGITCALKLGRDVSVTMIVDTGSPVSILPLDTFDK